MRKNGSFLQKRAWPWHLGLMNNCFLVLVSNQHGSHAGGCTRVPALSYVAAESHPEENRTVQEQRQLHSWEVFYATRQDDMSENVEEKTDSQ